MAALAARNFFSVSGPKPGLVRNEFGGTFSGPIIKNKTFFLGAYRASRNINSTFTNGNFSAVPGLALYDPATGNPDGTGRTPFANNIIPQNRMNPAAVKVSQYFPAVNQPSQGATPGLVNNYKLNVPARVLQHSIDGRVDQSFSERTKMFLRVNRTWANDLSGAVLPAEIGNGLLSKNGTINAIANASHTFSQSILSKLRLSYARHVFHVFGIPTPLNNQSLGIADQTPTGLSTTGIASMRIVALRPSGHPPTIRRFTPATSLP